MITHIAGCKHKTIVVYTRKLRHGFRKQFYVVCVNCEREFGPYRARNRAIRVRGLFNAAHSSMLPT